MKCCLKRITVLLIVFTLVFVFLPFDCSIQAYAESLNVVFDEDTGVLSWESYPGTNSNPTQYYIINIDAREVCRIEEDGTSKEVNLYDIMDDAYANGIIPGPEQFSYGFDYYNVSLQSNPSSGYWSMKCTYEPNSGSIDNAIIDDYGMLTWDPYFGASSYKLKYDTSIFSEAEWITIDNDKTEFNYFDYLVENGIKTGYYSPSIVALDENGKAIAFCDLSSYYYSKTLLGDLQNVTINNSVISWDAVPGVEKYLVIIDRNSFYVTSTSFNIDQKIDSLIEEGNIPNTGGHDIYIKSETELDNKWLTWNGQYNHFYKNESVDTIYRIYGDTRYETSLKVADAYKANLGLNKFDNIIIAYGRNYADALAGSYLSVVASAPILLVDNGAEHIRAVQKYIRNNLNPGGVIYLLGGQAVVPDSVVAGIGGYNVVRLGGSNRYETNLKILEEADDISPYGDFSVVVCSGNGFADSLSAAASGHPILLVNGGGMLSNDQHEYLKSLKRDNRNHFIIVGGTGAVGSYIERQIAEYAAVGIVTRIGGADRYETSKLFADYTGRTNSAVIAYGANFPDGLCGGSLAYSMGGPLLLAANGKTQLAAEYTKSKKISYGFVLGGPALVSDASAKLIFDVNPNSRVLLY